MGQHVQRNRFSALDLSRNMRLMAAKSKSGPSTGQAAGEETQERYQIPTVSVPFVGYDELVEETKKQLASAVDLKMDRVCDMLRKPMDVTVCCTARRILDEKSVWRCVLSKGG